MAKISSLRVEENWGFFLPMILSQHFSGPQVQRGSENGLAVSKEKQMHQ